MLLLIVGCQKTHCNICEIYFLKLNVEIYLFPRGWRFDCFKEIIFNNNL